MPAFEVADPEAVVANVRRCREAFPDHYIQLRAYDPSHTRQTTALTFLVQRPAHEPGFRLERQETSDRRVHYTLHPYATETPSGRRYGDGDRT